MCTQHEETKYLKIIFLTDLTDCEEVSERFGHLTVVNVQESVMHPISGEFFSVRCFTLRNFIFMVWEDQVFSSCMNIDLLAKIFL